MAKSQHWSKERIARMLNTRAKNARGKTKAQVILEAASRPLESHIVDDGLEAERAVNILTDTAERRGFKRGMIHVINLILEDLEPTEDNNV